MNRRSIMIASALLLTAGVSTASAQTDMVPHTTFGVLAGANFAKLSDNVASLVTTRTGFVGGITARFPTHTPVRPFIVLGPSVGFRIKCNMTATNDKEELSVSGRYNMAFTDAFQDSGAKNPVFSVLAGLSF